MYNKETGTCTVCGRKPGECNYNTHNELAGKINLRYHFSKVDPQPVETTFLSSNSPVIEGPHTNANGENVITVASLQIYPAREK